MQYRRYYLVLRRPANQTGLLTLAETARQAHLHPEILGRMVDLGLIDPAQTSPELLFDPAAVADVRRAWRLRNELGINWAGVGVVMDLLETVRQLERELERYRRKQ